MPLHPDPPRPREPFGAPALLTIFAVLVVVAFVCQLVLKALAWIIR